MRRAPRAFTLVELLVVIAIIGILVALLLPAIQAAREAARRAQCTNQLKQISLAWHLHHDAYKFLPSGGWGFNYMGDPDRGAGAKQSGGWAYSCLPFMEEDAVHNIGAGITTLADKKAALAVLSSTPVAGFYCPTRRPPMPTLRKYVGSQGFNADHSEVQARSDYAANLGPMFKNIPSETQWQDGGPPSIAAAEQGTGFWKDKTFTEGSATKGWMEKINGVVFQAYEFNLKHITDGTSKTYMVGEKYLMPEAYYYVPGARPIINNIADDQSAWSGDDLDLCRNADDTAPPTQDQSGLELWYNFGSAHPGVFLMSMCDASVRTVSFDVTPMLHERLGNRRDGESISDF
jgi:prepilin-type N-terminal cleavage/methylation domain-containing protein